MRCRDMLADMKAPTFIAALAGLALATWGACDNAGPSQQNAAKAPPPAPAVVAPSDAADAATSVRAPVPADLEIYVKDLKGAGALIAEIKTSKGTIHCELFGDKRPMTVANFIGLASGQKAWRAPNGDVVRGKPFYDGLTFHRVIPNFMVQGGDPQGSGNGGPGYEFANEIDPPLTHAAGALAMANAGPGTNGSQFYITEVPQPRLDGGAYVVFGQCKEIDVVKAIARVQTGPNDKPVAPVTIERVTIARGAL